MSDLRSDTRALLTAARAHLEPTAADRDRLRARVLGLAAAAALTGTASSFSASVAGAGGAKVAGAAAAVTGAAALAKPVVIVALIASSAALAALPRAADGAPAEAESHLRVAAPASAGEERADEPARVRPDVAAAALVEPAAPPPVTDVASGLPARRVVAAPARRVRPRPVAAPLADEASLLSRALAAERYGDVDGARHWLAEHARRFEHGALAPERLRAAARLERRDP